MCKQDVLHDFLGSGEHKWTLVVPVTAIDEVTNKKISVDRMHSILFGGEQLTRKRAEAVKELNKKNRHQFSFQTQ